MNDWFLCIARARRVAATTEREPALEDIQGPFRPQRGLHEMAGTCE